MVRTRLSRRARLATAVLGLLVLAQGAGKLLDLAGYVRALAVFPLVGESAAALGPAWAANELFAGVALLAGALASSAA